METGCSTGPASQGRWIVPAIAQDSIDELLEHWAESHALLRNIATRLTSDPEAYESWLLDAKHIYFHAPLARPGVIYAAGANYRDHVEAMGRAFNMKLVLDPKSEGVAPWHFLKAGRGTLVGHREAVTFPAHTQKLDWEAELAVVIGRHTSRVREEDALAYVAGYTCANDLSARDNLVRQQIDPTSPFRFDWIGHKCFTGACPLGPFLTPAEFVESPENLDIKLWLNGELRQNSNTSNHLYGVAEQIAYLSNRLDLYPGDIVLTGTPAGVGMETGTFLKPGDVMQVWIEGLGELQTTII
ncbi:fumarylacetoacetate hydrolase family protein [Polaromonas sp. P1(28)-8]|nr:fumarylacetoacetate hydrolase family protein [Polaromonas sp. P1(28)-8]